MKKREYEKYIDRILLPELTQKIAHKLQYSQEDLSNCKWSEGESNTDVDFSILAGEKTKEAFEEIIEKDNKFQNKIAIKVTHPDIKIIF